MLHEIPNTKLVKLSLFTSILFGLLGSVPFINASLPQSPIIWKGFIILFFLVLLQWGVNIFFLYSLHRFHHQWIRTVRYILTTLICMLIFYAGFELLMKGIIPKMDAPPHAIKPPGLPEMKRPSLGARFIFPMIQSVSINLCILMILELLLLDSRKQKVEKENNNLRIASLEARHSQLKQQLHPHFIFNSLNILKSLIRKSPEPAEEYLVQLSAILRFSIYSNKKTIVPLENELELTRHYLCMQQLRFGEALKTETAVPLSLLKGFVPVYSIQLLIENAIKHNSLMPGKPLTIRIHGNMEDRTVTVSNNLQSRLTVENGSGLGLSNLKERYQLLGNWPVDVYRDNEEFRVTIKILRHESSDHRR